MTINRRIDAARKFSGDNSYYNDTASSTRGTLSRFPASYPKYSLDSSIQGVLETGLRLYLPAKSLLKSNPADKDILEPLVNNKYIELIAEQVSENFNERVEIKKLVNGAFATYYFGINPPQLTIAGRLPNDAVDDWRNKMLRAYTRYMRGTRTSQIGTLVTVSYMDLVISGECTSFNTGLAGMSQDYGQFNLSMIVHTMVVRSSPIVSDILGKTSSLTGSGDAPTQISNRKATTVVRSNGPSDVISQQEYTPIQIDGRVFALDARLGQLQAQKTTQETLLDLNRQALINFDANFPAEKGTPERRRLVDQVRKVQLGVDNTNRAISELQKQKKQLREGTALRDKKIERRRSAKNTIPESALQLAPRRKPKLNTGVPQ